MDLYDFTVKDAWQFNVNLSDYKGKVLMIVNTATGCGFTPQYRGLQELYDRYKDQGFEILDFPCNQFMNQAPGTAEEIVNFCQVNFGVTFKTFAKINVNGKTADPLYVYLKQQAPVDADLTESGVIKQAVKKMTRALNGQDIKWNFTKFLIDRQGQVAGRYAPSAEPEAIEPFIRQLL